MSDVDVLFRRLAARGYFEIRPSDVPVRTFKVDGGTVTEYAPGVAVVWAPRGQGGPLGLYRFNPLVARRFEARSVVEALRTAVDQTSPPSWSIDMLAAEKERLRACTCKHHGLYPRGDDGLDCPVHPHPKAAVASEVGRG